MRMAESRKGCAPFIALFAMSGRSDKIAAGRGECSCFPTQAAKDAAWMGHTPSRENSG
jgi:hypothetical protein